MRCFICDRQIFKVNGYTREIALDELVMSSLLCGQCWQQVAETKGEQQDHWPEIEARQDGTDSVRCWGWKDTILDVKALNICPQCGEIHQ
jgi:hypothetical protein